MPEATSTTPAVGQSLVAAPAPDDLGAPGARVPEPQAVTFSPDKSRELMRGGLAAASFSLFAVVIVVLVLAVVLGWRTWSELQGMATSVLPVVVSVVGTTTGFYFGTREGARR